MVTIGMNYHVRAGKEQVFEKAFERVLGAIRAAEGHHDSRLFRSVDGDGREYLIVSRWLDRRSFDDFVRSDAFRKVTDWGAENILQGPPRHTTYRESA